MSRVLHLAALLAAFALLLPPQGTLHAQEVSRASDAIAVLASIQRPINQVGVGGVSSIRLGAVTFPRRFADTCIYSLTPDLQEQVAVLDGSTGTTLPVRDGGTVSGCAFRPGETRAKGVFSLSCGAGLTINLSMNGSSSGVIRLNPLSVVIIRTSDSDPGRKQNVGTGFTCPPTGLLAVDVGAELRLGQMAVQANQQIGTITLNAEVQ